jgi:hypothetical protein
VKTNKETTQEQRQKRYMQSTARHNLKNNKDKLIITNQKNKDTEKEDQIIKQRQPERRSNREKGQTETKISQKQQRTGTKRTKRNIR